MAKAKPSASAAEAKTDALLHVQVIDAMIAVVAAKGWNGATLQAIAEEAGLPLASLHRLFTSKEAIYTEFLARLDRAMLAGTDPVSAGDSPKDRLFDVIMNRFEALKPAKPMLARFWQDGLRLDFPMDSASILANRQSLAWTLEGAGISASGLKGQLRILGLAGVMLTILRAFLDDASEDLSPTMAKLDETLRRSDEIARTLGL
jgi:AcrR family transcriptional regulator